MNSTDATAYVSEYEADYMAIQRLELRSAFSKKCAAPNLGPHNFFLFGTVQTLLKEMKREEKQK